MKQLNGMYLFHPADMAMMVAITIGTCQYKFREGELEDGSIVLVRHSNIQEYPKYLIVRSGWVVRVQR